MSNPTPPPGPTYYFSLFATIDQQLVGQIPGGYRVDLSYSAPNPSVSVRPESGLAAAIQAYLQKKALLLSGTDWLLVSEDAIVDFDSRITLKLDTSGEAPPPRGDCVIGGRLRGRANLHDCRTIDGVALFKAEDSQNTVLESWKTGFDDNSYLPLVLAVSFDVPIEGFDPIETKVYETCRPLGRSLMLGVGKAIFKKQSNGAVSRIELDLYNLEPAK